MLPNMLIMSQMINACQNSPCCIYVTKICCTATTLAWMFLLLGGLNYKQALNDQLIQSYTYSENEYCLHVGVLCCDLWGLKCPCHSALSLYTHRVSQYLCGFMRVQVSGRMLSDRAVVRKQQLFGDRYCLQRLYKGITHPLVRRWLAGCWDHFNLAPWT